MVDAVNESQLALEARRFLRSLAPSDAATLVVLSGDVGSGKTTFAKSIAKELGIDEHITSPTFVIQKNYVPVRGLFKRYIHIDAYRLNDASELEALRWQEMIGDPGNLIVLEWPERVERAIPPHANRIELRYIDETAREIRYD